MSIWFGTDAAESQNGSAGPDIFDGKGGDDTLNGLADSDTMMGADGNDIIHGGAGNDTIDGDGFSPGKTNFYSGADIIYGDAGDDVLFGGAGNDTLQGGADNDSLNGDRSFLIENANGTQLDFAIAGQPAASGDDSLSGGGGDDTITSIVGADTLDGGAGTDTLVLQYAARTAAMTLDLHNSGAQNIGDGVVVSGFEQLNITAGSNSDHIVAGAANDTLDGAAGADTLDGGDGNNLIYGGAGDDVLTAGAGNDQIYADASMAGGSLAAATSGADKVDAGAGNDTVVSSVGADTLEGGAGGVDLLILSRAGYTGSIVLDISASSPQLLSDGTSISGFEQLNLTSGDGDDTVTGAGLSDVLDGRNGADLLRGGDGADSLFGGEGGDTLQGGGDNDVIYADASYSGSAPVAATAGNDSVDGGLGDDVVYSLTGADTLDGGDGTDTLVYARSQASIGLVVDLENALATGAEGTVVRNFEVLQATGGAQGDLFEGGELDDVLLGGGGADTLVGRGGGDSLDGGAGRDVAWYSSPSGGVTVDLSNGDWQTTGAGSDRIRFIEDVQGSAFGDRLVGGSDSNALSGQDGDDVLVGDGSSAPVATLASLDAAGQAIPYSISAAALSGDGGRVAFAASWAVVSGAPATFAELYVRDLATGVVTVASSSADGTVADGSTGTADFAARADVVAFSSAADNLVSGDTADTYDVFVKNLTTGAVTLVDATQDGTRANAYAELGGISADGTKIAFTSAATNLDPSDSNGVADLFIKDLTTGALTRVATTTSGDLVGGVSVHGFSAAGDKVLYLTSDQATADDHDTAVDAYVKDLVTGVITRVSAGQDGAANASDVWSAVMSADGGKVLFLASDPLTPSAGEGVHAYVRDLKSGALTLVSVDGAGDSAVAAGSALALSADGRFAAFSMYAVGDQPAGLYVKDLVTGDLTLVTNQYGEGYGTGADRIEFSGDSRELMVWGSSAASFSDGAVQSGVFVFDLHPAGNDSLYGGDGADTLDGGPGDDILDGGADNDTVTYAQATAGVHVNLMAPHAQNTGGAGHDTLVNVENLVGSSFDDVLGGSSGSNRLTGGEGNDTLGGGAGKDVLSGGAGNDVLDGGTGKNLATYADAAAGVTVDLSLTSAQNTGGAGTDTLTRISDLSGSAFNDRLTGDDGRNHINGGDGRDVLHGGAGVDNLQGGTGNDTLEGGLGRDILNGGAGNDTFVFDHMETTSDTIRNLSNLDVIDLHLLDADAAVAGDQAFALVDHFHNHAGEARLNYQAGQNVTLLQLDTDGDGKANMTITLEGQHTDFADFVL